MARTEQNISHKTPTSCTHELHLKVNDSTFIVAITHALGRQAVSHVSHIGRSHEQH